MQPPRAKPTLLDTDKCGKVPGVYSSGTATHQTLPAPAYAEFALGLRSDANLFRHFSLGIEQLD
jgi:hypothetical protein